MGLMFLLFLPPQPKPWPYCTARYAGTMGIKHKFDRLPLNSLSISVHTAASTVHLLPYSANFRGRKHSRISRFWSHLRKFSPWNLGVPYQPMIGFSIPRKFFSAKWSLLTTLWKFSSSKVSRYRVTIQGLSIIFCWTSAYEHLICQVSNPLQWEWHFSTSAVKKIIVYATLVWR